MTASSDSTPAPHVSVVMPCFNGAATLREAIEGVRAQAEPRFELIVVDDGSTDGGPDIVQAMSQADSRIRLVRQPNSGPSVARNTGVAQARADVIAFLDSDDMWTPGHLSSHLEAMARDPRLGLSFSRCRIVDAQAQPTGDLTRVWMEDITPQDILASNPTATCSSVVVRRSVIDEIGTMRADMVHAEDQEWLFRVVSSGWHMRQVAEPTVLYRTSPVGLSADTERMYQGWCTFISHARAAAPDLVAGHFPRAFAQMQLYYARRIIRTGQTGKLARRALARAIAEMPRLLIERPATVAALAAASMAPRAANACFSTLRRLKNV